MISHLVDIVVLLALVLTSLRVGTMLRALRRLRGYQAEYVEVFDRTSRAAGDIGAAVRHLGGEGRDMLERLETATEAAKAVAERLEAAMSGASAPRASQAAPEDDASAYSRRTLAEAAAAQEALRSEILSFTGDSRQLQERYADTASEAKMAPAQQPRSVRMAPGVKTLRAAGGAG